MAAWYTRFVVLDLSRVRNAVVTILLVYYYIVGQDGKYIGGKKMKFKQTIKNWLHNMFAWWPWKQSTQIAYSHPANPLNKGATQETVSKSTMDGIAPQTGFAPRLSTIEEWPERVVQSDVTPASEFVETPSQSSTPSTGRETTSASTSPTPQQRMEFLHYLIQRGIVNEGFEDER